jgi:hypothetical protein
MYQNASHIASNKHGKQEVEGAGLENRLGAQSRVTFWRVYVKLQVRLEV